MTMDRLSEQEIWRQARKPYQLQCERCHFCWYPKNPSIKPKVCPFCKSYKWAIPLGRAFLEADDELKEGHKRGRKLESKEPGREFLGGAK